MHWIKTETPGPSRIGQLIYAVPAALSLVYVLKKIKADRYLVYNLSILNPLVFVLTKIFRAKTAALVLHEPYKEDTNSLRLRQKLYFRLSEFLQLIPIYMASHIFTMSFTGTNQFLARFPTLKKKHRQGHLVVPFVPLEPSRDHAVPTVTIFGNFNEIKKLRPFIEFANFCIEEEAGFHFFIATASNISHDLKLIPRANMSCFTIINQNSISEATIQDILCRTHLVLMLQPTITQSGVFPLCMMAGVPIIAPDVAGFRQYFYECPPGVLLSSMHDYDEIMAAVREILDSWDEFSLRCKLLYESRFSIEHLSVYYKGVLC